MNREGNPRPSSVGTGHAELITAAPRRQVPAEDDGLNLATNRTWGGLWDGQTPPASDINVWAKWERGDWKAAAQRVQVGVQPEDSLQNY